MSGRDKGANRRTRRVSAEGAGSSLDLIHRNNSPKPASMRVPAVSYSLELGDSEAMIEAVFATVLKLTGGAYGRPT